MDPFPLGCQVHFPVVKWRIKGPSSYVKAETAFRIGLGIKAIDSLLEAAGGVILLLPVELHKVIRYLTLHELYFVDRHPTTARLTHAAVNALSTATTISAAYLVLHGLVKLILIIGVLRHKKWGYIGLIAFLFLFAGIEIYHGATKHSWLGVAFGMFDLGLVAVIGNEYKVRKHTVT